MGTLLLLNNKWYNLLVKVYNNILYSSYFLELIAEFFWLKLLFLLQFSSKDKHTSMWVRDIVLHGS